MLLFVDEAAEAVAAPYAGTGGVGGVDVRRWWVWWDEIERAVWAVAVVVVDVDTEYALEVVPVRDQEPIETFGADGSHEALGDRVRPRRPTPLSDWLRRGWLAKPRCRSQGQCLRAARSLSMLAGRRSESTGVDRPEE